MKVKVRLFGFLAEEAGKREISVEAETAGDALEAAKSVISIPRSVRIAVNEEYAPSKRALRSGDVVSLIPPVAGG
ncbi:MAG TPA: MoaD/ThiS family protein [Planctomycetota bacterium]|nr:MoaD/ThiS family protein [Planctomycetota bacterium]